MSSDAVLAWIDHAEKVLAIAADEPAADGDGPASDDHVPRDVVSQFSSYLRDWRPIAESAAEFTWSLEMEPEVAEYLVHAFFKLTMRQARSDEPTLQMPERASVFNRHLVKRMLGALSSEGPAEAEFAEHLRSFWPGLDPS